MATLSPQYHPSHTSLLHYTYSIIPSHHYHIIISHSNSFTGSSPQHHSHNIIFIASHLTIIITPSSDTAAQTQHYHNSIKPLSLPQQQQSQYYLHSLTHHLSHIIIYTASLLAVFITSPSVTATSPQHHHSRMIITIVTTTASVTAPLSQHHSTAVPSQHHRHGQVQRLPQPLTSSRMVRRTKTGKMELFSSSFWPSWSKKNWQMVALGPLDDTRRTDKRYQTHRTSVLGFCG